MSQNFSKLEPKVSLENQIIADFLEVAQELIDIAEIDPDSQDDIETIAKAKYLLQFVKDFNLQIGVI